MEGRRILVVDDETICRSIIREYLHHWRATAYEAADADTAASIINTHDLDLVLLDNRLPDCRGTDFFKSMLRPKGTPTILMTGYAEVSTVTDFFRAGGRDFLQKPLDMKKTESRIRSIFDARKHHKKVDVRFFLKTAMSENIRIISEQDAYREAKFIVDYDRESLLCLYLDNRGYLIHQEIVAIGSRDCLIAHARDVLAPALECDASAIIMAHNHPGGDPTPTKEDITLTLQIFDACEILGMTLIDHFIIFEGGYRSVCLPLKNIKKKPR